MENGKRFGVALLMVFFVAGFLFGGGFHSSSLAAEKGPIKIGFIAGITGNWAQFGNDMVDGFKLRLSEMNYTVAGRKVELIVEDESTNPAMAVTKARKLISHDKVNLLAGVFLASSGYAVAPIAEEAKLPLVVTIATADDLTQRKANKYLTRLNWGTSSEFGYLSADYAYKKLGWRKAAVFGYDYAWGHEVGGGFLRAFEELGGKVIQRIWTPVNTTDFGPYVTSIRRDVDGICDVITGAATIRLINSIRVSDLKGGIIGPGQIVDESFLPALGDSALGVYSIQSYSGALDTPENAVFKEKLQKAYKKEAECRVGDRLYGCGRDYSGHPSGAGRCGEPGEICGGLTSDPDYKIGAGSPESGQVRTGYPGSVGSPGRQGEESIPEYGDRQVYRADSVLEV